MTTEADQEAAQRNGLAAHLRGRLFGAALRRGAALERERIAPALCPACREAVARIAPLATGSITREGRRFSW